MKAITPAIFATLFAISSAAIFDASLNYDTPIAKGSDKGSIADKDGSIVKTSGDNTVAGVKAGGGNRYYGLYGDAGGFVVTDLGKADGTLLMGVTDGVGFGSGTGQISALGMNRAATVQGLVEKGSADVASVLTGGSA